MLYTNLSVKTTRTIVMCENDNLEKAMAFPS